MNGIRRILSVMALAALGIAGAGGGYATRALPAGNVILWNKLGSDAEVLTSEVGPGGSISGSAYAYEAAKFGAGYVRAAMGANYVTFPSTLIDQIANQGTIELWINPKVPNPVPYTFGVFGLIGQPYGQYFGLPHPHYDYEANINLWWGDGVSGCGLWGGVRFGDTGAETPIEPVQFVAAPGVPFHVALVWDNAGIEGSTDTVRVYRDGVLIGAGSAHWNPDGAPRYDILLGYGPDTGGYDKFITDNIIIRDFAMTDFSDRMSEAPFSPPICSGAAPSVGALWPPNGKFTSLAVDGVVDTQGLSVGVTVTGVRQDEAVGKSAPDAFLGDGNAVRLRAERDGSGDGRVYHVAFSAANQYGLTCTGTVKVSVPHSTAQPAIDGGPIFDSTGQ